MADPTPDELDKGSAVAIAYADGNEELFVLIAQAIADACVEKGSGVAEGSG